MDIKDRFSEESLQIIKKYLQENNNKSMILKATFDDNELIQEPFFLSLYKKKNFEETLTKVSKNEVVIRTTKPNQLYPSDMELELSEELYNRRNIAYCLLSSNLDDFYFVQDIDRAFLDGLIIQKRGKREDGTPIPQVKVTKNNLNNILLRKLRIALSFKSYDMIKIFKLGGVEISEGELSALFRSEEHKNYKECGDKYIRVFLKGLTEYCRN